MPSLLELLIFSWQFIKFCELEATHRTQHKSPVFCHCPLGFQVILSYVCVTVPQCFLKPDFVGFCRINRLATEGTAMWIDPLSS